MGTTRPRRLFLRGVSAVFLLGMLSLLSGCTIGPPSQRNLEDEKTLEQLERTLRGIEAAETAQ